MIGRSEGKWDISWFNETVELQKYDLALFGGKLLWCALCDFYNYIFLDKLIYVEYVRHILSNYYSFRSNVWVRN